MRAHLIPEFGPLGLGDITAAEVRRWLSSLIADGLAPATATRCLRILGSCLQTAADDGLIPANPARGTKPPRTVRTEQRYLNPEEVGRLVSFMDPRYRALVLVAAWCGLRIGELTGLKVKHVNPLLRRISIVAQIVEVGGRLIEGEPKSRAGIRVVSVPRHVMAALAAELDGKQPDQLVFTAPEGGPIRRTLWAKRFWRPAVDRAGLAPLRIHDLRHTAVSFWPLVLRP
jgi:integrase